MSSTVEKSPAIAPYTPGESSGTASKRVASLRSARRCPVASRPVSISAADQPVAESPSGSRNRRRISVA